MRRWGSRPERAFFSVAAGRDAPSAHRAVPHRRESLLWPRAAVLGLTWLLACYGAGFALALLTIAMRLYRATHQRFDDYARLH